MLSAPCASAETLSEAITLAYRANPTLQAQRAELRAVDETYVQARAGYGPSVSATAGASYQAAHLDQPSVFGGSTGTDAYALTGNGDLSIVQPLYTGGQTASAVSAASADILAGREQLRQTEAQVFQAVATAYLDVRRDLKIVAIAQAEVDLLAIRLSELRDRGRLGALSRVDVSQGEARWLAARARLLESQGRLSISRSAYVAAVGRAPGDLAPEPVLAPPPPTVEAAFEAAEAANPQLREAIHNEEGSRARTAQARALNHSTLSLRVDVGASPLAPYDRLDYDRNVTAAVVFNRPIFTSGLGSSRVREALARDDRDRERVEAARRAAVQAVSQAWDQLAATRGALEVERPQVEALRAAAEGQRVESRVGLRSVIDLLNAEQELESGQIALAQDEHDAYLAHIALLAAMGGLDLQVLAPSAPPYDPRANFLRHRRTFAAPWEGVVAAADRLGAVRLPSAAGLTGTEPSR